MVVGDKPRQSRNLLIGVRRFFFTGRPPPPLYDWDWMSSFRAYLAKVTRAHHRQGRVTGMAVAEDARIG